MSSYSPQRTQRSQRKIEYQKTEVRIEKMLLNELTEKIIDLAIKVLRKLALVFYSPQRTQRSQRKIEYLKTEVRFEKMLLNELTEKIIGLAIKVH